MKKIALWRRFKCRFHRCGVYCNPQLGSIFPESSHVNCDREIWIAMDYWPLIKRPVAGYRRCFNLRTEGCRSDLSMTVVLARPAGAEPTTFGFGENSQFKKSNGIISQSELRGQSFFISCGHSDETLAKYSMADTPNNTAM